MGDATGLVRLRFTGRWHCNRLLGFDRRCYRHDICLYIFGRDGFNVSPIISPFIRRCADDLNYTGFLQPEVFCRTKSWLEPYN